MLLRGWHGDVPAVGASSRSTQQLWAALRRDGSNHLGLWLNGISDCNDGPDHLGFRPKQEGGAELAAVQAVSPGSLAAQGARPAGGSLSRVVTLLL